VPVGDARRNLKKSDARVIEFLTESEVELGAGPQAPDSDERLGGHRLYELGGVIHVANLADPTLSEREEPAVTQLLQRGYSAKQVPEEPVFSGPIAQSDIPEGAFVRAAVDNLRRWILSGEAPPRAESLALNGKKLARDEVGNPREAFELRNLRSRLRVTDVMRGVTSRVAVKTGPILSYSCYGMNCLRKSFEEHCFMVFIGICYARLSWSDG